MRSSRADNPDWVGKVRIVAGEKTSRWFWLEVAKFNHIWDKTMDEIGEVTLEIPPNMKGDVYIEMDFGFSTSPDDGGRMQKHMSWRMNKKEKISE